MKAMNNRIQEEGEDGKEVQVQLYHQELGFCIFKTGMDPTK